MENRQDEVPQSGPANPPPHPDHGKVRITVDNEPQSIHPGNYRVSKLKETVGVDASRALDQVVNGEFKELDDGAHVHIKGGEIFVSHVRTGGSS